MTKPRSSRLVLGLGLTLCLSFAGCASSHDTAMANDRLREKVVDLEKQIKQQNGQISHLNTRIKQAEASDGVSAEIRDNTPHVASISIGNLSHLRDNDSDGKADELVVYIKVADGWGRTIQLVGQLSVHAVAMPVGKDAVTLGRISLDPAEVRRAYRSSIAGTHYTVNVALVMPEGMIIEEITVRVEYLDGYSGVNYTAQQPVKSAGPFDFAGG